MKIRWRNFLLLCGLIMSTAVLLFGQRLTADEPRPCTDRMPNKGKYRVLSIGRGVELQVDIAVAPKHRTDRNYIAIAKELKERYCHESRLRVTFFASKKSWMIVDPKNLEATPLAIFYSGQGTSEKEGMSVYTIVNGKIVMRELNVPD